MAFRCAVIWQIYKLCTSVVRKLWPGVWGTTIASDIILLDFILNLELSALSPCNTVKFVCAKLHFLFQCFDILCECCQIIGLLTLCQCKRLSVRGCSLHWILIDLKLLSHNIMSWPIQFEMYWIVWRLSSNTNCCAAWGKQRIPGTWHLPLCI